VIGGLAILAALVFVGGVFILGAEAVSEKALPFFGIATVLAIVFCLVIFLPLSIFRATRIVPIWGFFIASYVFGVYTWMFSFLVTFSLWGVGGVFVGLCLAGIGIFPLAIIAAALHALWSTVGNLAFGIVITCGTRIFSFYLATTLDRAAKQAEVAGNVKEEEGAKPFGSPVRKEGLLTVRGFLSITHMIVLAGLWYVLAATADFLVANDRGGVLGIKLLIGYFLLMEFIFTNNWLVARVEHRMGYSSRSEENTYSVTSRTPLSDVGDETGQPTAIEVETPRPELD